MGSKTSSRAQLSKRNECLAGEPDGLSTDAGHSCMGVCHKGSSYGIGVSTRKHQWVAIENTATRVARYKRTLHED